MTIKILIADDHLLMRQGIVSIVQNQPDMTVIGEADNGQSAVELAARLSPHIVLMDITMPILNGIEATRQILAANDGIKVIALSVHNHKFFIQLMLSAGASGYVLKGCDGTEVIKAIHTVMGNQTYLSPGVTDALDKNIIHQR